MNRKVVRLRVFLVALFPLLVSGCAYYVQKGSISHGNVVTGAGTSAIVDVLLSLLVGALEGLFVWGPAIFIVLYPVTAAVRKARFAKLEKTEKPHMVPVIKAAAQRELTTITPPTTFIMLVVGVVGTFVFQRTASVGRWSIPGFIVEVVPAWFLSFWRFEYPAITVSALIVVMYSLVSSYAGLFKPPEKAILEASKSKNLDVDTQIDEQISLSEQTLESGSSVEHPVSVKDESQRVEIPENDTSDPDDEPLSTHASTATGSAILPRADDTKQMASLRRVINRYARSNPKLSRNGNTQAALSEINAEFVFSEYGYGVASYPDNLVRLKVVWTLLAECSKSEDKRIKALEDLKPIVTGGFPPWPLWAAIAYCHIKNDDRFGDFESSWTRRLSFSADEALFLYSGMRFWRTEDPDLIDCIEKVRRAAQGSNCYAAIADR